MTKALDRIYADEKSEADAVLAALQAESGSRGLRRLALADEVRRLVADPEDTRERRSAIADLESVTPDWPE